MDVAGIDIDELRKLRGTVDLGWNHTGIIRSRIHFTGDEIITHDEMPGEVVDEIISSVDRLRDRVKKRRPGGDLVGQIPLPLWTSWRREWAAGPKLHGVVWRAFFASKFMDSDYSKFRAGNI